MPKRPTPASRVKSLLRLDAAAVLRRLEARQDTMVLAFSRHRDRQALLGPIRSRFHGAGFDELVQLTPAQQEAATHFYELLDDLAYYFTYTEDMPGRAGERLQSFVEDLRAAHALLEASLKRRSPRKKAAARKGKKR